MKQTTLNMSVVNRLLIRLGDQLFAKSADEQSLLRQDFVKSKLDFIYKYLELTPLGGLLCDDGDTEFECTGEHPPFINAFMKYEG